MEVKVKNSELKEIIDNCNALLTEKISFGVKNRIIKIINEVAKHHESFNKMHLEAIKANGGIEKEPMKWSLPDMENIPESFKTEMEELGTQEVTIIVDGIDYSKLENLETDKVYNIPLLSPFFENYQ